MRHSDRLEGALVLPMKVEEFLGIGDSDVDSSFPLRDIVLRSALSPSNKAECNVVGRDAPIQLGRLVEVDQVKRGNRRLILTEVGECPTVAHHDNVRVFLVQSKEPSGVVTIKAATSCICVMTSSARDTVNDCFGDQ